MRGGESKGDLTNADTDPALPLDLWKGKPSSAVIRDELVKIIANVPLRRSLSKRRTYSNYNEAALGKYLIFYRQTIVSAANRNMNNQFEIDEIRRHADMLLSEMMGETEKKGRVKAMRRQDKKEKKILKNHLKYVEAQQKADPDNLIQNMLEEMRLMRKQLDRIESKGDDEREKTEQERKLAKIAKICNSTDISMIFQRAQYKCSPLYWHRLFLMRLIRKEKNSLLPKWLQFNEITSYAIDITYTWTRSVLQALIQSTIGPAIIGMKQGAVIKALIPRDSMVTNLNKAAKMLIRSILEWLISLSVLAVQFVAIYAIFQIYDILTESSTSEDALVLLKLYMNFLHNMMIDAFSIIPRMFEQMKEKSKFISKKFNSPRAESRFMQLFGVIRSLIDRSSQIKSNVDKIFYANNTRVESETNLFFSVQNIFAQITEVAVGIGSKMSNELKAYVNLISETGIAGVSFAKDAAVFFSNLPNQASVLLQTIWSALNNYANPELAVGQTSLFSRPYSMRTVCKVLDMTQSQVEAIAHPKLSQYIRSHALSGIEVAHAVFHVHKLGVSPRRTNLSLRF